MKFQKILVIHRNAPGQFERLMRQMITDGHEVVSIGQHGQLNSLEPMPTAIKHLQYQVEPVDPKAVHRFVANYESHMRRATGVAKVALQLKQQGFEPDLILAHTGWGEALLLPDVFPDAKYVGFFEYFYHAYDSDVDFDPEFVPTLDDRAMARLKNVTNWASFEIFDRGYSPTQWQRSLYPAEMQSRLDVIHDGIDTEAAKPNPHVALRLGNARLTASNREKPVISFVARSLEPYRGIHQFVRAIPQIQAGIPGAEIVIIGDENTSYGRPRADGKSHLKAAIEEVQDRIDMRRLHVLGSVDHKVMLGVMQASTAHVYLTYPFVLSWSMLEAMACGAEVIASDVASVREVITDKKTGHLVDFLDVDAIANKVIAVCQKPTAKIKAAGRELVLSRYDWATHAKSDLYRLLGLDSPKVGRTASVVVEDEPPKPRATRAKKPAASGRRKTPASKA